MQLAKDVMITLIELTSALGQPKYIVLGNLLVLTQYSIRQMPHEIGHLLQEESASISSGDTSQQPFVG